MKRENNFNRESTMKMNVIALIIFILAFASCGEQESQQTDEHHDEHKVEEMESAIVHLDKHKVFHAGIRVEAVEKKSVAVPLTLPGKVVFNDRRLAQVSARANGRIEHVHVFTNSEVKAGSPLLEIYSQEFQALQSEFLQTVERLNRAQKDDENATARAIYESAKRRLVVVGLTEEEVKEIESTRMPFQFLIVRAPFGGTILESKVRQGTFVQAGTELFDLADLSTLWVLADIYEKDLSLVRVGMQVKIEVPAYPESFIGTISTIYNVLDEKTRTVKARVQVENKHGKLKPEMFCTVNVQTQFGKETIKIPANALFGETEKHFVFVALNDTTFERRDVRTGFETRDFSEILDGLLVGELIVVKGGFFLKSELAKETFGEEH